MSLRPIPSLRRAILSGSLALLALAPAPALAQTPEHGPLLLEIPWGARTVGLGGAPQIDVSDPDLLFSSPAHAGSGGFRVTVVPVGSTASAVSLATSLSAFGGGLSFGLRTLEFDGGPAGTDAGGLDPILSGGEVGRSTRAATVGYSRGLFGFDVGASGTWFTDRADADRVSDFSFDVGVARSLGDFELALNARNLGPDIRLSGAEIEQPLTIELLAAGYGQQLGPVDLGLTARVGRRADEETIYGGGLEIGYWPIQGRTFIARIGARNVPEGEASPLSLGGSFLGDDIVIDYAFRPVDGLEDLHVITLGWR